MKTIIHTLVLAALLQSLSAMATAGDALLVVGNVKDQQLNLTREQVRNLFMGASLGIQLQPLSLPPSSRSRSLFNTKVIGLTESRIQSYWAQMKFTGRMTPPPEFASEAELIEYLARHPGTVGYVSEDADLPKNLHILFTAN